MDLKKLKSGTDIRGTAVEGFGADVDLTDENVYKLAAAFAVFLKEKNSAASCVAVGRDSRVSGPRIERSVIKALTDSGINVLSCGLCSTPSMFMMTVYEDVKADASIMITASHHPMQRNGLKFFLPSGGLEGEDISKIIEIAEVGKKLSTETKGETVSKDYMSLYCAFLRNKIIDGVNAGDKPLLGFKFVVDAGNGAGGFYAERVLKPLGADVDGSQFLEPDGTFPNHIPNPENADAMKSICECTLKNKADLGIIFDTDVDRAAVVASDGEEINRNRLIALISAVVLRENPGATIVTDSVTSDGLRDFIVSHGGKHHRFKRGYRNVIDEAIRLEASGISAPLAIETSGHAALKENYFLDDGAYLVTRLIIESARMRKENKKLGELIADLYSAKEELEVRLSFKPNVDFKRVGAFVIESLKAYKNSALVIAPDNYEGVRFSVTALKGWFLVRMSVHDPIMPINIESNVEGGAKKIASLLYAFLKEFKELDVTNLVKAIG